MLHGRSGWFCVTLCPQAIDDFRDLHHQLHTNMASQGASSTIPTAYGLWDL
jgi:hypothetical protein